MVSPIGGDETAMVWLLAVVLNVRPSVSWLLCKKRLPH